MSSETHRKLTPIINNSIIPADAWKTSATGDSTYIDLPSLLRQTTDSGQIVYRHDLLPTLVQGAGNNQDALLALADAGYVDRRSIRYFSNAIAESLVGDATNNRDSRVHAIEWMKELSRFVLTKKYRLFNTQPSVPLDVDQDKLHELNALSTGMIEDIQGILLGVPNDLELQKTLWPLLEDQLQVKTFGYDQLPSGDSNIENKRVFRNRLSFLSGIRKFASEAYDGLELRGQYTLHKLILRVMKATVGSSIAIYDSAERLKMDLSSEAPTPEEED